ncbi:MAG: 2-dehydropantoate 2-reductase [SAR202 cluster bacterium]|nr:2-dehydropantoate 2-reductase [SAR202 cluster bacterium]
MNVLVMAAGAVGGYFGSVMAEKHDVVLVARNEHLKAIQEKGLQVQSKTSGNFISRATAVARPEEGYVADIVLYCVKAYHNDSACDVIAPAVGPETTVLTLQNGIGSGDFLSNRFGEERVLLGAAYIEASRGDPGITEEHGGGCRIALGEKHGMITRRTKAVSELLKRSNIDHEVSGDIMSALWKKLVFITALSGMTCLARARFEQVLDNPQTYELAIQVMSETKAVADAEGIDLPANIVKTTMDDFMSHKSELVSSMHQDLLSGRPLEVNVINGAVSQMGKIHNVSTPINDIITSCLSLPNAMATQSAE